MACPYCGNSGAFCTAHSKVKMFVGLKTEYKTHYKYTTWYSFLKTDKKPMNEIIKTMIKNLEPKYRNAYNSIRFYNNQTGTYLCSYKNGSYLHENQ